LEATKYVFWQAKTELEMSDRVKDWLRTNHAELSKDAIRMVANRFCFDNK
jgi:hypothetical protein